MPTFIRASKNSKTILTKEFAKKLYFSPGRDIDLNFHKIFNPGNQDLRLSDPMTLKQLRERIARTPLQNMKKQIIGAPDDVMPLSDLQNLYNNVVKPKQILFHNPIKFEEIDYRKPNPLSIYNRNYVGDSNEEIFLLRDFNTKFKWETGMDKYLDYRYINYFPNGFYFNGDKMSQFLYDLRIIVVKENKWSYAPL